MNQARILLADDHPLFRQALRTAVEDIMGQAQVLEAGTLDEVRRLAEEEAVDLILLDLTMPGSRGLAGLVMLRGLFPQVAVAIVSANEDIELMERALTYGAAAYIPKSVNNVQLAEALRCILGCGTWLPPQARRNSSANVEHQALIKRLRQLSPQQFKVLHLLAEGQLNKQIADQLGITEPTVKTHVTAILRKLDVRNRTQAVLLLSKLDQDSMPADPVMHATEANPGAAGSSTTN